ncbi:MAG TPA: 30S ribosomal protein S9 [Candidatus Paceibacterota bacterium]
MTTKTEKQTITVDRYVEAVGRRKTAIARVRLYPKKTGYTINGKAYQDYFPMKKYQEMILTPFEVLSMNEKMGVNVLVRGGGINAQAEAVRHGISRALVVWDETFRKRLRVSGFLTRDPRMVERKKYGLKKARRAPQWAKR